MSNDRVQIVPVGPDRAGEVALVLRTSFQATYPDFPVLHSLEGDTKFVRNNLMKRTKVEAAMDGDKIVGVVAYDRDEVDKLYLLPEWQGRGLGKRLLARALNQSDHLRLATFQANTRARVFYAAHGFVEIAYSEDDNEEGRPDVQMEWRRP